MDLKPVYLQDIMQPKETNRLSRRQFIRLGGAGAAAVTFGVPYLLRAKDVNGKLNVAFIGLGGQGKSRLKEALGSDRINIVALCDVDLRALEGAKADIAKSYDLQVNCYLSKPAQWDAFASLVKSIINFWLTQVKLPQQRTNS